MSKPSQLNLNIEFPISRSVAIFTRLLYESQMVSVNNNTVGDTDHHRREAAVTLAHISDPHIACIQDVTARDLLTKRLFGYLKWKLHRGARHGDIVLSALRSDLMETQPDHIVVTGDLTHLSLPAEFKKSRRWLQSLGSPSRVTVIPGNHDRYVRTAWNDTMAYWEDYMQSDAPGDAEGNPRPPDRLFPLLRIRGPAAIIGVDTALPTPPYLATGSIGDLQLQNLESLLAHTARQKYFRVVLIHHCPVAGRTGRRKRLTDAAALQAVLDRQGAELILHGHDHRDRQSFLSLTAGRIPVMGAASISALDRAPNLRARYYLYRISPEGCNWKVGLAVRIYHPGKNQFIPERSGQLIPEPG